MGNSDGLAQDRLAWSPANRSPRRWLDDREVEDIWVNEPSRVDVTRRNKD
jgi:pilus assembly protein CpaF